LLNLKLVGLAVDFRECSTLNEVRARNLDSKELIATIFPNSLDNTGNAVGLGNNFGTDRKRHENS
tara:strand:- start:790 stop:984 length:195 start_codon:yes stop_codon:yes gene_type:complete